jgi:3-phenylpropionate/trans-cinnamate dioxygenase ferredoxin subunit
MKWINAGPVESLPEGEAISIPAGRRMIAVACSGNSFYAVEDICTHDGAPLTGGTVEDAQIICPRHGARFCLRTGAALTPL